MSDDGRPYMVMEYVEGRPITDHCAIIGADLEQRLDHFKQVSLRKEPRSMRLHRLAMIHQRRIISI